MSLHCASAVAYFTTGQPTGASAGQYYSTDEHSVTSSMDRAGLTDHLPCHVASHANFGHLGLQFYVVVVLVAAVRSHDARCMPSLAPAC